MDNIARNGSMHSSYRNLAVVLFVLLHVTAIGAVWVPLSGKLLLLMVFTYCVRMFGVTGGYHRYFSHRSYKLGRSAQFAWRSWPQTSGQKGVLWWAAHHRDHHRYSDREEDVHSPWQQGFWWSHVGWVLSDGYDDYDRATSRISRRFPELRWLDRYHWVPTALLGAAICGPSADGARSSGATWSPPCCCTTARSASTRSRTSWARRRFDTPDHSRNNFVLALVTFGEGWHNNHHFSPELPAGNPLVGDGHHLLDSDGAESGWASRGTCGHSGRDRCGKRGGMSRIAVIGRAFRVWPRRTS